MKDYLISTYLCIYLYYNYYKTFGEAVNLLTFSIAVLYFLRFYKPPQSIPEAVSWFAHEG